MRVESLPVQLQVSILLTPLLMIGARLPRRDRPPQPGWHTATTLSPRGQVRPCAPRTGIGLLTSLGSRPGTRPTFGDLRVRGPRFGDEGAPPNAAGSRHPDRLRSLVAGNWPRRYSRMSPPAPLRRCMTVASLAGAP